MNAYRDQYAKALQGWPRRGADRDQRRPGHRACLLGARDPEYPFLFASDSGTMVARQYGALVGQPGLTNRNLFVVGPDGKITYRAIPFREVNASAYTDLGAAIGKAQR